MHCRASISLLAATLANSACALVTTDFKAPSDLAFSRKDPGAVSEGISELHVTSNIEKRTDGVPRPLVGNVPYGTIINKCTISGTVALTFDDGPSEYTDIILDHLHDYNVKATFFVNGYNNPIGSVDDLETPWPGILQRMYREGHQVASHTWSHMNLSSISPNMRNQEVILNEMALSNVLGVLPTYLRPPYASCTQESGCLAYLLSRGYHIINFDVNTVDYNHDDPGLIQWSKDVFADTLRNSGYNKDGSNTGHIVLSHDSKLETAISLTEYMLTTLQELGYRAVTVGECLGDPPENWYRNTSPSTHWQNHDGEDEELWPTETGECGPVEQLTYRGASFGQCCSKFGFCGNTLEHCGPGCQGGFGSCH